MTEPDPVDRFLELNIVGYGVTDIEIWPEKKAILSLDDLDLMFADREAGDVGHQFELQFNRVLDGAFEAKSNPWIGKVTSHSAYRNSAYLQDNLERRRHLKGEETVYHFEVVFEQGRLNVVANGFVYSLLQTYQIQRDRKT